MMGDGLVEWLVGRPIISHTNRHPRHMWHAHLFFIAVSYRAVLDIFGIATRSMHHPATTM
jgi:hypothetical protein